MRTSAKDTSIRPINRRGRRLGCVFTLVLGALLAFVVTPAGATKTHLFQETFGSAAQPKFEGPDSLAIDRSSGDVLVIDRSAKTISRFNPDGTPDNFSALGTNVIDAKGTGDQTPQNGFTFGSAGEQQVAVDNSGTATDGNIYVTQGIQAAGNLIDVFASSGEYLGQLTGAGATKFGTTGSFPFSPCGVTVDASGNLFVGGGYEDKVFKFDPSANLPLDTDLVATYGGSGGEQICNLAAGAGPSAGSLFASERVGFKSGRGIRNVLKLSSAGLGLQGIVDPEGNSSLLAVDEATGHLYTAGNAVTPQEFDGAGSVVSTFSSSGILGIAVDGSAGRIYTSRGISLEVFGPLVTVPGVTTDAAAITGDTSLTLNGTVDPDGVALEECSFEYGPTTAYGQTTPCAESLAEIGTSAKAVHADLSGLAAETLYHYRLVAKNLNDTVEGSDKTVKTPSKPGIPAQWSIDVGTAEATLKAQVNPENSPTTYRFEWGLDSSYGNSTADIAIGSDNTDRLVSLLLSDLTPGTTYHYRVVAGNGIGETEGDDHSFTTYPLTPPGKTDCPNQAFRSGASARLPDCRAYEMVSPVDKNGDIKVLVELLDHPAAFEQSSLDGDRFAYSSSASFGDAVSAPFSSEYLGARTADGWVTKGISPPRFSTSFTDDAVKFDVGFRAFSPDLNEGWLFHDTEPTLDPCAPQGLINLYHRDNASGTYEALITAPPLNAPTAHTVVPDLGGVSADGTRAVFGDHNRLLEDAVPPIGASAYQLYEHVSGAGCGELRLVSVRPNGKAFTSSSWAGGVGDYPGALRRAVSARAVSADGSRVFFTTEGALYVRVNSDQEQSLVSGGKCTEEDKACTLAVSAPGVYRTAATDGSKVIYTVGESLYEFDVDKALAGEVATTLIAEGTQGVSGASEDASRVYFVSSKALGDGGVEGKTNLYLYDSQKSGEERYRLVAQLSPGDLIGFFQYAFGVAGGPIVNGARLTPDGAHLVFPSTASISGYDNTDVADGLSALELFIYDAESDEVACVSCNPSGSRPRGRKFGPQNFVTRRVSAQLPPAQNQLFTPRALGADGDHLFFESFEALLPRDTNGKGDVYQWQRASGEEDCEAVGAELYVPSAGGCLSLISSGQSPIDSELIDANPDGSDVFIKTAASLLPQDPGLVDVYDVREGGGLPPPPGIPAGCEGEACQGPLAPPNDPTPASSAFEGAGNVVEKPKPKARKKKRAHKKQQAKKQQAKKRHQRAKHNGRAGR